MRPQAGRARRRAARPGPPRARTSSRTPSAPRSPNGLRVIVTPMPGRAARSPRRSRSASGAADEPAGLAGATVLAARGPHRGHGGPRRDRADRGRRAARRLAPRRGRLGRDVRRASTCPRAASRRALELLAEVVRRPVVPRAPRSTACATSGSPTCSRRRPTRGGAPTRRTSSRSTRRRAPYHRPAGGTAETVERLTAAELRAIHDRALRSRAARRSSSPATSIPTRCSRWPRPCSATGPAAPTAATPARSTTPRP